jgi:dipeptidyl aminopeptidase/acylaminoacyl peptidase
MTVRRDNFGTDFRRDGDPTYVRPTPARLWIIDADTRDRTEVLANARGVRSPRFSPDGSKLGMLLWSGQVYEPAVYDRASRRLTVHSLPSDRYAAEAGDLRWTADGRSLVFPVHSQEWKRQATASFTRITGGPVFVQNSRDPFLAWDELRRMANRRSVGAVDVARGAYRELIPETQLTSFVLAEDGSAITYSEDLTRATSYEAGGADGRMFTVALADWSRPAGAAPRVLYPTTRGVTPVWAEDGKQYALTRDGRVFVASIADTTPRFVIGPPPSPAAEGRGAARGAAPDSGRGGRGAVTPPATGRGSASPPRDTYSVSRFSPTGDALLVSNREGMWVVSLSNGERDLAIATGDTSGSAPRVSFATWSGDGAALYFTVASRTQWERSVVRYDRATKTRSELAKDARSYSNLRVSRDGRRAFLTVAEGNRPGDIHSATGTLDEMRRFIVANPQLEAKRFGPTELMRYLDADGHQKWAVVHYPLSPPAPRAGRGWRARSAARPAGAHAPSATHPTGRSRTSRRLRTG